MTLSLPLALLPASGSELPGKCLTKPWAAGDPGPVLRGSDTCLEGLEKVTETQCPAKGLRQPLPGLSIKSFSQFQEGIQLISGQE